MKGRFRKPYGKVFSSVTEIKIDSSSMLITVGDTVSYNSIRAGLEPKIIVFDLKNERRPVDRGIEKTLIKYKAKKITVENPPSNITNDLWEAVKKSLKEKSEAKIFVKGEEDLAVLPFILESPVGTTILYGLKDKGVMVKVNKKIKNECRKLIDYMVKPCGGPKGS